MSIGPRRGGFEDKKEGGFEADFEIQELRRLIETRLGRQGRQRDPEDIIRDQVTKFFETQAEDMMKDFFKEQFGDGKNGGAAMGGDMMKHLEHNIDGMVASVLVNGRQTGGILRTLFGLVPSLIGR